MRKRLKIGLLAGATLLGAVFFENDAKGSILLDQSHTSGTSVYNGSSTSLTWQQEVKAGVTGQLDRIEVFIQDARWAMGGAANGEFNFAVVKGSNWQTSFGFQQNVDVIANTVEEIQHPTINNHFTRVVSIDVSAAMISLSEDEMFVMQFQGLGGTNKTDFLGSSGSSPYTRGFLRRGPDRSWRQPSEGDMFFNTYMRVEGGGDGGGGDMQPVPEPATLAMWSGLGMIGLAFGYRQRRKTKALPNNDCKS